MGPSIASMPSLKCILLVTVGLLLAFIDLAAGQDTNFFFHSFDCLKDKHLQCTGDSTSTGEGQLNLTGPRTESTGRALYLPGIRLLDPETSKASFFSTNFTFSTRAGDYRGPGEGLAFVILSNPSSVGAGGGFLGIYGPDGHAGTPRLAVEFDTFKNVKSGDFKFNDINGNHVGVDIESIISNVQVDAGSYGFVFTQEPKLTAWVDYYAPTGYGNNAGSLQVRISRSSSRPSAPILSYEIDLSKVFTEFMYVGFSAATGDGCFSSHNILDWGFSSWGISARGSAPSPPPSPTYSVPPIVTPVEAPGPLASKPPGSYPAPVPSVPTTPGPRAPYSNSPPNQTYGPISPASAPAPGPATPPPGNPYPATPPTAPDSNPGPLPPQYPPTPGPSPPIAPPVPSPEPYPDYGTLPPPEGPPTTSPPTSPPEYNPGPPGDGYGPPGVVPPASTPYGEEDNTMKIVVPIVASLGAVALLAGCCLAFACCRKKMRGHHEAEAAAAGAAVEGEACAVEEGGGGGYRAASNA